MKTTKISVRLFAMFLVAASFACRQSSAQGAEGDQSEPVAPPATTVERPAKDDELKPPRPVSDPNPPLSKQVPPPRRAVFGGGGSSGRPNIDQFGRTVAYRGLIEKYIAEDDSPSVITSESIDPAVQSEWQEDLRIMDKLFRDTLDDREVKTGLTAMGIAVGRGRSSPAYVEGAGVVITSAVGWPLAATPPDDKSGKPRDPASPWDRAKRGLNGNVPGEMGMQGETEPQVFEQKKLDRLVEGIFEVFPQASNFRHLKPEESVIVTISGADDSGRPMRLTMKAKKSDIDAAAAGTLDATAFKQRVARRVG